MNPESKLFIYGQLWDAHSGARYHNISPVSEQSIGEVADAGPEDMERAIAAARRAFDKSDWSSNHSFTHHGLTQLPHGLTAVNDRFPATDSDETEAPAGHCGRTDPPGHVSICLT